MIFLFGIYINGHCGAIMHSNGSFHVKIGTIFQRIHDNLAFVHYAVEYSYDSLYRLTGETITDDEKVTAYAYENILLLQAFGIKTN